MSLDIFLLITFIDYFKALQASQMKKGSIQRKMANVYNNEVLWNKTTINVNPTDLIDHFKYNKEE